MADPPKRPRLPRALCVLAILSGAAGLHGQEAANATVPAAVGAESPIAQGLRWLAQVLALRIGDNATGRVLASFVILLSAVVLRKAVLAFLFGFLLKLASRTRSRFDDRILAALRTPASWLVLVLGVFLALTILHLPAEMDRFVLLLFKAATLIVVFWGFLRTIDVVSDVLTEIAKEKDLGIAAFAPLLKKTARYFFLVVGVILIIQNLGYSVGSLLAGLGIGGLAVALAAQDSIANFFGSVVVATDRPLRVGDFVAIGAYKGTVEEVGLRSTRLRTAQKTLVTIPNKTMASEPIENFTAISRRRIDFTIGVTYQTRVEEMEALLADLRRIVRADEGVDAGELQLVRFQEFGASSLDIRVICFAGTGDFAEGLAVRERLNLKVMRAVLARGLSFAFPTRTVHVEGEIPRKAGESAVP